MAAQAKLEDSNISNYGSKEHKDLKKGAAEKEEAWKGCGKAVGVEIWRIEKFQVVRNTDPETKNGSFFGGDAYIVLNTYRAVDMEGKLTDKLLYNVHFWLGAECSQDEQGVAAYKTVELDDLLGDLPVQYREVQGSESPEFLALFKGIIQVRKGGVDSGFTKVKPEEYKPRLLHMKGSKQVRVTEVKCSWKSLNDGDVFLLDAGLKLWQWNGKSAGIAEKRKANELIASIKQDRHGKPTSLVLDDLESDETFWGHLGGKPGKGEIAAATSDDIKPQAHTKVLWEVSDKSGELKRTKTSEGKDIKKSQLDQKEVFILDCGDKLFIWIGSQASKQERGQAMTTATKYLSETGRPLSTPCVRVMGGAENPQFNKEFA